VRVVGVDRRVALSRGTVWAWYLVVGGVLTSLYALVPPFAGSGPLINLLGFSSAAAIAVGIRLHKPQARLAWWLFVAGQFLFFLGDLYTYSYPRLFHVSVPFPSLGDGLYLGVYPALMAGLLVLVRRRNPDRDRAGVIDSLILTVGVGLISWIFLIAPYIHVSGMTVLAKGVSMAYPGGDLLLLAAVIRLAVDGGRRAPAFFLLVSSILCLLVTDAGYGYLLLVNSYTHQVILDVGWIGYYLLWGAAALHPSMRTLDEPALERGTRLTPIRLALLGAACLVAPVIFLTQVSHRPELVVVIISSMILFLLVVARMAGLVRQEARAALQAARAVIRERALRKAGHAFVGAAVREQIFSATLDAIRSLAGSQARVAAVAARDQGATLLTPDDHGGAISVAPLTPDALAWLEAATGRPPQTLDSCPSELQAALAADPVTELSQMRAVILDLAGRDGNGFLIVAVNADDAEELIDPLQALAVQVVLAVERTTLAEDLHRQESEARLGSLVAHSTDLITVLDPQGIVVYQSPSIDRVLGMAADQILGTSFSRLVRESDRARLAALLEGAESGPETRTLECSLQHGDGNWREFEVQYSNLLDDKHVGGLVLNSRDISERKAFENQLAHQAFHDQVTGLANRALFQDRVSHALSRLSRDTNPIAIMFIDLDDFKTINDSLGHTAGDRVLQTVATRIAATIRPSDTAARFGGDEFAVLLEGVDDSQQAADLTERLIGALEQPLLIEGQELFIGASVGICISNNHDDPSADDLLRNADVAMYMAKRDLKGSYRVFESTMHENVVARLELRADLQRAIESGQLEVQYQPMIRLDGETIYGFEALLRWHHPTRGDISPIDFIPLAEETGLIIPIGRWVLNQACHQATTLQQAFTGTGALSISVNLSVKQLQSETILTDVQRALQTSGLSPASLVLEITESVMMADTDLAVARLEALKALGVRLAMDDFGTGYSSLSYLNRFPVDILKMDRSFLRTGAPDSGLAAAIVSLGDALNLQVVAEGIEQTTQLSTLRTLGCDLGQGFLFAKAMPIDAVLTYLTADKAQGPVHASTQREAA
jgi:diguanylate cyclase (GGDEF)-like protein/PAS domain S-box-containing protein